MNTSTPPLGDTSIKFLLKPRSVAVIGASEDQTKFGGRLYKTLLHHQYDGVVYPINPVRNMLFGLKTYASVGDTPDPPDMVVMALPRDKVKNEIAACAARGVKAGIIITSKFSDAGAEGAALEREIVDIAAAGGMRLIGPNCLGVISPAHKLVLCASPALHVPQLIQAPIGFVSQSGALMGNLFDRAYGMGIGFSHCVSVGNQADLELCDFIEFLIEDDQTRVICSYVEGVKSPQRLRALAQRARAAGKPWLMVKAGMSEEGSRAAYSHTASLAGDFAALQAVCAHENIVLMDDPLNMLSLARAMVRYPKARVERVAVITTSGGGGAVAADRLAHTGIELSRFNTDTRAGLAQYYSPGQAGNPIDLGGRQQETENLGVVTTELTLADPAVDLALMVLTTAPDVPGLTKELARGAARLPTKPVLYVMLPGRVAVPAREFLVENDLPYVDTLAEAMEIVDAWKTWSAYKEPGTTARPADMPAVVTSTEGALDESASKALLQAAGIRVNQARLVRDADEAADAARALGFPVVLKVVSPDITHKSDVGGVALNIRDESDLRARLAAMQASVKAAAPHAQIEGYSLQAQEDGELEIMVGAHRDAQFGVQVMVGAGGTLVELLKDTVVLPAPVAREDARRAVERLRVAPLLRAWRGRGALDVDALVDVICRLGWLALDLADHDHSHEHRDVEIDINPLKLRLQGQGAVAVDARVRIRPVNATSPATSPIV